MRTVVIDTDNFKIGVKFLAPYDEKERQELIKKIKKAGLTPKMIINLDDPKKSSELRTLALRSLVIYGQQKVAVLNFYKRPRPVTLGEVAVVKKS